MPKPFLKAKSEHAATTNKVSGSLIKCEVKVEHGRWIAPDSCSVFKIDADARFPEIWFEIEPVGQGPCEWSWQIQWKVQACPQNKKKGRFKPKREKIFSE
ncbi:MAG: hypothetical protein ACXWVG_12025 [Telluria sp.]